MSKLYLMRHGQTLFNERKQGWCDSPLTEEGMEQARRAGAWIREHGITFDHCYASTQERACDTIELVVPGMPYERVKGLKEWNFGRFEAITEDVNPPLPYGDFYVTYGGESQDGLRDRVLATIDELMSRPDHESVLMMSHGAAVAQVMHALNYNYRAEGKRLGNCCVIELDYTPGTTPVTERLKVVNLNNPNA